MFDYIVGKLLLIGIALFITAIIAAKSTAGLSSVEGLVVLNLLWTVNTAMLLLSMATPLLNWFGPCPGSTRQREERYRYQSLRGAWNVYPCSVILHSVLLAAFGLWFWTSPNVFRDDNSSVYYWIFGRISIRNSSFRKASFAIYIISAIPGINMMFHAIVALSIPALISAVLMVTFKRFDNSAFEYSMHATASFAFLAQPIYFIVSTEMVINTNFIGGKSTALDTWTIGDTVFLLITATSIKLITDLTLNSWQSYFPVIDSVQEPTVQHADSGGNKNGTTAEDVLV
jgi:hypothetical protein